MGDELKDQRIPIMMSPSEVKAIDDWMFANRVKSRAEAIRRLCQKSLATDSLFMTTFERTQDDLERVKSIYKRLKDDPTVVQPDIFHEMIIEFLVQHFASTLANLSDLSDIRILKQIYDGYGVSEQGEVPVSSDLLAVLKGSNDKRTVALAEARRLSDQSRAQSRKQK